MSLNFKHVPNCDFVNDPKRSLWKSQIFSNGFVICTSLQAYFYLENHSRIPWCPHRYGKDWADLLNKYMLNEWFSQAELTLHKLHNTNLIINFSVYGLASLSRIKLFVSASVEFATTKTEENWEIEIFLLNFMFFSDSSLSSHIVCWNECVCSCEPITIVIRNIKRDFL